MKIQNRSHRLKQHWQRLNQHGLMILPDELFHQLLSCYQEPQRYYHTLQHIEECLDLYQEIQENLNDPVAVALAIWFHDAVYDPRSGQNEFNSAELMQQCLEPYLGKEKITKIYRWILATQTHAASSEGNTDLNFLLDIDLAILASQPTRFAEYEVQIREEYAWVPEVVYTQKRREVLTQFFKTRPLFKTAFLQERFEEQARINLKRVLKPI